MLLQKERNALKAPQLFTRGFTLIELMIVVAVIAIIAAVAIPTLLGARMAANEASATSTLRTVGTSVGMFHTRVGRYPEDMAELQSEGYATELVGGKHGCTFNLTGTGESWNCIAVPDDRGTGYRYFVIGVDGAIYDAPNFIALRAKFNGA